MPKDEMVESTSDERVTNNTMRHQYRILSDEEKQMMQAIKDKGSELLDLIHTLGSSRECSIAKTKTEEAVMWAVKHITAQERDMDEAEKLAAELEGNLPEKTRYEDDEVVVKVDLLRRVITHLRGIAPPQS